MKDCAKKGIHNVVIVSGGGKELGGDRAAMEAEVKHLSLKHKIRVIGPNCIGMFNAANRLDCAFQGQARMVRARLGNVATDYVRFNFATSRENISKAIEKIDKIPSIKI